MHIETFYIEKPKTIKMSLKKAIKRACKRNGYFENMQDGWLA
jgi:hypothetical protein